MHFFEVLKDFDIILGSRSPRRKWLLEESGIPFRVLVKETNEDFCNNRRPDEIVISLSRSKAEMFTKELENDKTIVITADTIVVIDGKIINKPGNEQEAIEMLKYLSGRTHEVFTGVCILGKNFQKEFYDRSLVRFMPFEEEEIIYYINEYKPFDKAGSYGIQEWLGFVGIESIEGSFFNVMGLPIHKVYSALKDFVKNIS